MRTYIVTFSERQEKDLMELSGIKTRRGLAHMLKGTRVLYCSYYNWEYFVIDNSDVPDPNMTFGELVKYVRCYLSPKRLDNKSRLSRLASVLMRLLTFSIKPSHVPSSGNDGSTTECVSSVENSTG